MIEHFLLILVFILRGKINKKITMLKKIFDYLFYSCRHTWEIHHSGNIVNNKDIAIGAFYHLKCSKCGEMKFKRSI